MIESLSPQAQQYFNYLLFNPLKDDKGSIYQDYRAGSSLLFLFPFYIQVGLAQIFYTSEQIIANDFNLTLDNSNEPIQTLTLSYNLLGQSIPPYIINLFSPNLNGNSYNSFFGLNVDPNVFVSTSTYSVSKIGTIGNNNLFSTQDTLLFRDRVNTLFTDCNYSFDQLENIIQISLNNSRISATTIFCQYFNIPTNITQQIINDVEQWNINN